jgi:hypothetical protein
MQKLVALKKINFCLCKLKIKKKSVKSVINEKKYLKKSAIFFQLHIIKISASLNLSLYELFSNKSALLNSNPFFALHKVFQSCFTKAINFDTVFFWSFSIMVLNGIDSSRFPLKRLQVFQDGNKR